MKNPICTPWLATPVFGAVLFFLNSDRTLGGETEVFFAASRATTNEAGRLKFKNETSETWTYGHYDVFVEEGDSLRASVDSQSGGPRGQTTNHREWLESVAQRGGGKQKVVVYVHGFRNSFMDAVEGTAILTEHMKTAIPIVYSWPASKEEPAKGLIMKAIGLITDYNHAVIVEEDSASKFAELLGQLGGRFGQENVSIVAHSFGNAVTVKALTERSGSPKIRNLVMVAPDIRREHFDRKRAQLEEKTKRVTIYFAEDDLVLKASTARDTVRWPMGSLGNQKRGSLFNSKKTDVIDSSYMCRTSGGHSYHTSNRAIRDDISNLIDRDKPASLRTNYLKEEGSGSKRWFTFKNKPRTTQADNRRRILGAVNPIIRPLNRLFKK